MTDDLHLMPISGRSRDGRPLAFHRAPSQDLSPWIARLFVTAVDQPEGQMLSCGLLNDTPFVRLIVRGEWEGDAANGLMECSHGPLLFGSHSKRMPIRVTGPFATFGFALRPGALHALGEPWGPIALDEVKPIEPLGPWKDWGAVDGFDDHSPAYWLEWLEAALRVHLAKARPPAPSDLGRRFDIAAFTDPAMRIRDFAEHAGVAGRQVERAVKRDFGLSPKQVMRRARVLDMASQLLGFADREEAEAHALRFYDQSHLIRDFRALLDMTPRDLARNPQPILTLGLESRQARRLELLGRSDLPWR